MILNANSLPHERDILKKLLRWFTIEKRINNKIMWFRNEL